MQLQHDAETRHVNLRVKLQFLLRNYVPRTPYYDRSRSI